MCLALCWNDLNYFFCISLRTIHYDGKVWPNLEMYAPWSCSIAPSGVVHDSLPFILPLALPWRLHEPVQWQRPVYAALGHRVQVSVLVLHIQIIFTLTIWPDARSSILSTVNSTCTQRPLICLMSTSWSPTTSLWLINIVLVYWSGERESSMVPLCWGEINFLSGWLHSLEWMITQTLQTLL